MTKRLLSIGLAFSAILSMSATNDLYTTEEFGDMNGVSDNGRYAAISDNDNLVAYLWDSSSPSLFVDITPEKGDSSVPSGQRIKGATANDVSDSGLVVGGLFYADGKSYPAYYDGKNWTRLELPVDALNNSECVAVTPDGKIIAGYCAKQYVDYDGSTNGQYYPVQWKLNAEGEYELISYHDLDYYDHQGFWPTCMSADGAVVGGRLYCGVASTVPAIIANGELVLFDEITFKLEPFTHYFNGVLKYYCGTDKDGQIWSEDPDDPRIVYFREPYIDGVHDQDMEGAFNGSFSFCDKFNNFYGYRTRVKSVDEDGENAEFLNGAAVYNYTDDAWTYNARSSYYTCGDGEGLIFANDNVVYVDGIKSTLADEYDISSLPSASTGIAKISMNGKVLGGVRQEFFEAIGDYMYFPYVIVCEDAFSGTKAINADSTAVIVGRGYVAVANGDATVYSLDGRMVGAGNRINLLPGTYVVVAGDKSLKVVVR